MPTTPQRHSLTIPSWNIRLKKTRKAAAIALAALTAAAFLPHSCHAASLEVAATTGIVADLVRQIAGTRANVFQLMGPGVDPHTYKPAAEDATRLSRAAVIFYNGLHLEGRMATLLEKLAARGRRVVAIAETVPQDRLIRLEEFNHFDPHIWMDASLWALAIPSIVHALSHADPEGAAHYQAAGDAAARSLAALHQWCLETAATIPEPSRILVTSHDAFNYFGRAYGFRVIGLQGVSTVSEVALADIATLTEFIRQQQLRAIFIETSVNPAAIRRVAETTGVRIGGELFSDALGHPGEIRDGFDVGTYQGMMRYNMSAIAAALRE